MEPNDGVDVTLIQWMLSLTPAERLDALQSFVDDLWEATGGNAPGDKDQLSFDS